MFADFMAVARRAFPELSDVNPRDVNATVRVS